MAYDTVRAETELGSQHSILAIRQAANALTSVREAKQDGLNVSRPDFTSPAVTYDHRTMTLFEADGEVSLTTIDGRIRCELVLPKDDDGYQFQFLDSENWEITESTLKARDGGYFLHIGFRKPVPEVNDQSSSTAENRTVLGVDLGIENLAVTSTAHFESGTELLHEHREFEKVRRGLQRTGTESALRSLQRRGNTEQRSNRDFLHRVSNAIVNEAVTYECDCIVFENLKHIGSTMPGGQKFHKWAHSQLVRYVQYKANGNGIDVAFVNPKNTSRRCCECGHTGDRNRAGRDWFECEECGNTANADYNAAKNIGLRFVRRGLQNSRRTGHGQLALKSGTVKPNGVFTPYSGAESEAEDTDKPVV
jgi:putative transposase